MWMPTNPIKIGTYTEARDTAWLRIFGMTYEDLCKGHCDIETVADFGAKLFETEGEHDPIEVARAAWAKNHDAWTKQTFAEMAVRAGLLKEGEALNASLLQFAFILVEHCAAIGDGYVDEEYGGSAGEHIRAELGGP